MREQSGTRQAEYLSSLHWDGKRRVYDWPFVYLGEERYDHLRLAALWMVDAVRRAFEPGCKVVRFPVIVGKPALGKSSLVQTLAGEFHAGYTDRCAHRSWIVEIDEKVSPGRWHRCVSASEIRWRPPYAKDHIMEKLACIFIGTANHGEGLEALHGSFALECRRVGDVKAMVRDRDQLWAEAVDIYRMLAHA